MSYHYHFKGTFYFRKNINKRYLINRTKNLIYRRSLKLCVDEYYYSFLAKNNDTLDKLCKYINANLTRELMKRQMDVPDINGYIQKLTNEYKKEAMIENSILEEKRIADLEYIDENGLHPGYLLQSISRKYKEIDTQYRNLSNSAETQRLGVEIVKHSNISNEDILKIPADKLIHFYEMLIKRERNVLENDLKRYVERNLFEFRQLFSYDATEEEQISEAFFNYLQLIKKNKPSVDYVNLIENYKQQKSDSFIISSTPETILQEFTNEEPKEIVEDLVSVDELIDDFIYRKKFAKNKANSYRNSLRFLKEFLNGDGKNHKKISIKRITLKDIEKFNSLLVNCMPKNKGIKDLTIFELVKLRERKNAPRMMKNSAHIIETQIKGFWKDLSNNIYKYLDPSLFDKLYFVQTLQELKEDLNQIDPVPRAIFEHEAQMIINTSFKQENLKKILLDDPKKMYSFLFSFLLGLRIGEFITIKISDIKVQEKNNQRIYYIWLNEDDNLQDLKNQNAHRNIIIPELLIDLGFLNYVEKRMNRDKKWLWDFPEKSQSASLSMFWQREFEKLFPNDVLTKENRPYNYIYYRSFRKNFVEKNLSENSEKYNTDQNKKRLQGHEPENSSAKPYLGRLEPFIGKHILDAFGNYNLDFEELKSNVKSFYKEIKRDLDIQQAHSGEWSIKSYVKVKRGRKT